MRKTATWTQSSERVTVSESWLGPANGVMVATNLSTWPSDDEALMARTEGMMRGQPASEEWRFRRVQ